MIIGFSGFAHAGKDAAGSYLEARYGFRRVRFAGELKEIVARVFAFSPDQIEGGAKDVPDARYPLPGICPTCGSVCSRDGDLWLCEACRRLYPLHLTPRLAMQTLGTDWGRRLFANVWIELALRELDPVQRWAFCDVRFANEVRAIQARGGIVVRLLRGAPESAHPSEAELADRLELFDRVIDNRGSLDDLHSQLDGLMAEPRFALGRESLGC